MLKPSAPRANSCLKFRDSLTLMDSRFRGNDGYAGNDSRLESDVSRSNDVIPAKAGIHRLIQDVMNPET